MRLCLARHGSPARENQRRAGLPSLMDCGRRGITVPSGLGLWLPLAGKADAGQTKRTLSEPQGAVGPCILNSFLNHAHAEGGLCKYLWREWKKK